MTPQARQTLTELRRLLKPAALANIGGFRPPDVPTASWFGRGVCLPSEGLPRSDGRVMFPLLQINVTELPFIPDALAATKLLVVFYNINPRAFKKPHGEGCLIREYKSLEGLVPLPVAPEDFAPQKRDDIVQPHPFPIQWTRVEDDAPGWDDAWDLLDLTAVNEDEEASDLFSDEFEGYSQTKVGGYPYAIQHEVGLTDFVFQIGSEEKPRWMWADGGVAYFFKNGSGEWRWDCQFY